MQRYEIATLTTTLGAAAKAAPAIESFCGEGGARGRLLGCWSTELGPLNQLLVLRGFDTAEDLTLERQRVLDTTSPFGCAEWLTAMELDSYIPFPGFPPVQPGAFGKVYEIRTYRLKPGGLPQTVAAWQRAVPARRELSPLTIAMHAVDGPPRFTHVWPYASLEARGAIRAEAIARGIWPPQGGPAWLTGNMRSTIGLPTAHSPLH
jgi:hypothetical protein